MEKEERQGAKLPFKKDPQTGRHPMWGLGVLRSSTTRKEETETLSCREKSENPITSGKKKNAGESSCRLMKEKTKGATLRH